MTLAPLTILCFVDTRWPIERANGVQTMATCHALAARGHHVTLVARPDTASPPRDPFEYYGVAPLATLRIETIGGPRAPRARRARFLWAALARIVTGRPDVVYTRDLGLAAFLTQLPTARRPPLVYESHGLSVIVSSEMPALLGNPALAPSRRKLERLDRRERRVWQRAGAYVTITTALADELTSRYGPRDRAFVVPDGARVDHVDGSQVRSPVRGSDPVVRGSDPFEGKAVGRGQTPVGQTPVAGYAGHLYPWKGVDVFVRALALAPQVRGLIVGGHPGEPDAARVEALVRDLGLTDRVEMTGLVRPSDVRARLAPATLLVLPNAASAISERYTSPLKLFEYLTMRRPIIASDLPSIREVLTDGTTAVLVAPGDPAALARAMTALASDPSRSAALADTAYALAPAYSWARRAERLEAALTAAVSA